MVAALSPPSAAPTQPAPPAPSQPQPSFFHRLLSELNPLQYLPVIGTIYRAATGDVIPTQARLAGSLVVSGLTSGPIGVAIDVGAMALERITGIDPEEIGTRLLADIGIGGHAAPATALAKAAAPKPTAAPATLDAGIARPWSVAQLTAYGVVQSADGTLVRGAVSGADVLNGLELSRLVHPDGGALLAAVA